MKKTRYHADFFETFKEIREEYGAGIATGVMQIIVMRHGNSRIYIPDPRDVYREERDRKIRSKFNGANLQELAILFRISISQARRIVQEG